jgi:uncharacterized protein YjhX (UPF0386 family)
MLISYLFFSLMLAAGHHHHDVDQKGDKVMGFPHDKTTHHFRLFADGGAIEVEANEAGDAANRDKIRQHLGHIAHMFAGGDFSAPMLIHSQKVPGTEVMKLRKAEVSYRFEELARGGRVRITTKDKKALAAVHEFLRFQISDHRTGDSGKIE